MSTQTRFRQGKNAHCTSGGSTLYQVHWKCDWKGDIGPTDNFESGGYHEGLLGFQGLNWALGGNWDFSLDAFANPPGLYPRDDGTSLVLVPNSSSGGQFSMSQFICEQSSIAPTATTIVTFDSNGQSQGSFSTP